MKTQTSKLPDGGGVSVTGHWALGCDLAQAEGLLALDLSPDSSTVPAGRLVQLMPVGRVTVT